jgi:transmembrane sensor
MPSNTQYTENELLISRFICDQTTEAENEKVKDLLLSDNKFKELFLSMQQKVKAVDAFLFYDSIDEEKALKEIHLKAGIKERVSIKIKKLNPLHTFLKIACIIIVGAFIAFLIKDKNQEILLCSKESVIHENLMPDSSKITLNKNTSLQYSNKFGIKNRTLKLNGEAYFSVKKNTQLPFIVDCDGLFVEVTGTSFSINNYTRNKIIKVYVTSGQVKVYNNEGNREILNPGEMVAYNRNEKTLNKARIETNSNINSWFTQTLSFEDCPLQQVIDNINHYYNVDIQLNVTNIQNCRLSANFEKASLESVLKIICLSFGLELVDDGTLYLTGDGC